MDFTLVEEFYGRTHGRDISYQAYWQWWRRSPLSPSGWTEVCIIINVVTPQISLASSWALNCLLKERPGHCKYLFISRYHCCLSQFNHDVQILAGSYYSWWTKRLSSHSIYFVLWKVWIFLLFLDLQEAPRSRMWYFASLGIVKRVPKNITWKFKRLETVKWTLTSAFQHDSMWSV